MTVLGTTRLGGGDEGGDPDGLADWLTTVRGDSEGLAGRLTTGGGE